jgi:hypothetical protein
MLLISGLPLVAACEDQASDDGQPGIVNPGQRPPGRSLMIVIASSCLQHNMLCMYQLLLHGVSCTSVIDCITHHHSLPIMARAPRMLEGARPLWYNQQCSHQASAPHTLVRAVQLTASDASDPLDATSGASAADGASMCFNDSVGLHPVPALYSTLPTLTCTCLCSAGTQAAADHPPQQRQECRADQQ